jgi:hypothetical protein
MKNDSKYEKTRQDVFAPLVDRVPKNRRDNIFIYTLSCGLGWKKIVFDLVDELDRIWDGFQKKKGRECWSLLQMKEKFGGLRFYASYPDSPAEDAKTRQDRSFDAICKAEAEAWKTCERCGKPGKISGEGYIATVCEKCEKRWKERTSKGLWPTLFG